MAEATNAEVGARFGLPAFAAAFAAVRHAPSVRAGTTRALILPLTSAAALYTARLELHALGSSGFGLLTLLLAITLLLPFADLGVGAAVTNAVAADALPQTHLVVAASVRALVIGGLGVIAGGAALTAAGFWSTLTGVSVQEAPTLGRDMFIVMALFGVGLPLALGGRILLATARYPLFLLIQACAPIVTLALVVEYRNAATMTPFLIAPFAAQVLASLAAFTIACRGIDLRPSLLWTLALARSRSTARRIRATAGPMLLITIGLPLALQTDRLVLSHVSTRAALSQYAIVAVLFGPAWSVISSAGLTLWPKFAAAKADAVEDAVNAYTRAFRAFAVVGAVGAVAFLIFGPFLTKVWAGHAGGGPALWFAFALLLIAQAAHLPGGMFLTHPRELRFQAACVALMCIANLPLSIALAAAFGASGPVLASAATIFALQLVPARLRILRSQRPGVPVPC